MQDSLEQELIFLYDTLMRVEGQHALKLQEKKKLEQDILLYQKDISKYTSVVPFFEQCSTIAREQTKHKIESLVTMAIQTVMNDQQFEFKISMEINRGQLEAYFVIKNGGVEGVPEDTFGNSLIDVIDTFLMLILGYLLDIKGIIALDEPFRMVDADNTENASQFLVKMSKELNRQIICITHSTILSNHADKIFRVTKQDGISTAEEIK